MTLACQRANRHHNVSGRQQQTQGEKKKKNKHNISRHSGKGIKQSVLSSHVMAQRVSTGREGAGNTLTNQQQQQGLLNETLLKSKDNLSSGHTGIVSAGSITPKSLSPASGDRPLLPAVKWLPFTVTEKNAAGAKSLPFDLLFLITRTDKSIRYRSMEATRSAGWCLCLPRI